MKFLTAIAAASAVTAIAIPKDSNSRLLETDEESLFFRGHHGAGQQVHFRGLNEIGEHQLIPEPNDVRAVKHALGQDGAGQQKHLLGVNGRGQQKHLLGLNGAGQRKHALGQDGAGQHQKAGNCVDDVLEEIIDLKKCIGDIEDAVSKKSVPDIVVAIERAVAEAVKIKTTITNECKINATAFDNVDFDSGAVGGLACLMEVSNLVSVTHQSVSHGFMANQARDSIGMQHTMNDIKFTLESIQAASRMCNVQATISAACIADLGSLVQGVEALGADAKTAVSDFSLPDLLKIISDLATLKTDVSAVITDCQKASREISFSNAIVGPMQLLGGSCHEKFDEILSAVAEVAESLLVAVEKRDVDAIHSIVSTRVAELVPTVVAVLSTCQ